MNAVERYQLYKVASYFLPVKVKDF